MKAAGITATASFPQFKLNGWFNLELGRLHYMIGRGEAEEVCLCMGGGGGGGGVFWVWNMSKILGKEWENKTKKQRCRVR